MATATSGAGLEGVEVEATSVLAWFAFYTRLYEDDNGVARPSRTLLQLLQSAFPVLYEDVVSRRLMFGSEEWACVVMLLEAFYEVELRIDRSKLSDAMTFEDASAHAACVKILEFVVSALVQSDGKARFVRDIMTMEDSVQVDIMAVIECVMTTTAELVNTNQNGSGGAFAPRKQGDDRASLHESGYQASPARSASQPASDSPSSLTSRSPLHLSRNADVERLQRANEILKEDNVQIMEELFAIKLKFEKAEAENSTLLQTIQEVKLQAEMDILKKERTVRSFFDERIHAMQRELDRAAAELEEKAAIAKDVHDLRDEIDLLRPSAEKLAKAEATLAKYKTKIEELTSAKEKLRRIEEANTELVEKNLVLENQAAKSASLQRKLADSKETNTTIQFRVSELESQLTRLSSELEAKRAECETSRAALAEVRALNQQLQQTVGQQAESTGGFQATASGSVGSISELSPELMEKLARLEHDNKTLRSQVDGTTSERIDALVDEVEDTNRMKKSFEAKYFETNESLKETRATLKTTEDTLAALQLEHASITRDLAMMRADRDDQREKLIVAKDEICVLGETNDARQADIQRLVNAQECLEEHLSSRRDEIASLQLTLHQTSQELHLSNERNDLLVEDVQVHQAEKQEAVLLREELHNTVRILEDDLAARSRSIGELDEARVRLENQLSEAHDRITTLQQSGSRHSMRCEELEGVLAIKVESIAYHEAQISQLIECNTQLERDIRNANQADADARLSVQRLTEHLGMASADLAAVHDQRLGLRTYVATLLDDVTKINKALNEAHKSLAKTEEDYQLKLRLAEEDKEKEIAALSKNHAVELEQISVEKADIVTRMTGVIDEKFVALQVLKDEMEELRDVYSRDLEAERSRLEHEKEILRDQANVATARFEEYAAAHTFSNDDVTSKESALQSQLLDLSTTLAEEKSKRTQQCDSASEQVRRLSETNRDMKQYFEGQVAKLKDVLRAQLDANQKLMETNHGLKMDLLKANAHVEQLEKAVTRLDSRILVHERERAHMSSDEGWKRDSDDSGAPETTELSSHVTQLMEDYELLRQENQSLHEQLTKRQNDLTDEDAAAAPQGMKAYLTERIRQLDLAKLQEENKKREILLANAKLIQDQKQLQVKHASDARELQLLKEKVNTWMLRDERRKKEHESFNQRLRALEAENKKLRMNTKARALSVHEEDSSQSSQEPLEPILSIKSASSDDQENIPPETTLLSPVGSSLKKRKLDEAVTDREDPASELASHEDEVIQSSKSPQQAQGQEEERNAVDSAYVPTATAARRAKRRMSVFISNRLTTTSASTQPVDEKPSECQQQ